MANKIKTILRWAATPFAAVIGGFIAYFLVAIWIKGNNYGFQLYNSEEVGSITQIILAIIAQAVFGGAFVVCGAITAPKYKHTCSIVLATIIGMLSLISIVFSFAANGFQFLLFVQCLATIIGAIIAAKYVCDNNLQFD